MASCGAGAATGDAGDRVSSPASLDTYADRLRPFRQGLKDAGFIEGENVAIDYRGADNQIDRLPALAAELVRRQVAVIVAGTTSAAFAAKTASTTVPIVFSSPEDPVGLGLVASLARPDGNLTGINWFASELSAKRLELLQELVPGAARVALLVEPAIVRITEGTVRDVEAAARAMGLQIRVLNANTSREIDTAFATLASERPDALFVGSSPLFNARRVQLAHWATHHRVPATYSARQYVEAGGLMSYGASLTDASRQLGVYAGRILKGAKPADLPVIQAANWS
jgi:putative ABC transport system substrate-binding protein